MFFQAIGRDDVPHIRAVSDQRIGHPEAMAVRRIGLRAHQCDTFGCGNGQFSRRLGELGATVHATELSEHE